LLQELFFSFNEKFFLPARISYLGKIVFLAVRKKILLKENKKKLLCHYKKKEMLASENISVGENFKLGLTPRKLKT